MRMPAALRRPPLQGPVTLMRRTTTVTAASARCRRCWRRRCSWDTQTPLTLTSAAAAAPRRTTAVRPHTTAPPVLLAPRAPSPRSACVLMVTTVVVTCARDLEAPVLILVAALGLVGVLRWTLTRTQGSARGRARQCACTACVRATRACAIHAFSSNECTCFMQHVCATCMRVCVLLMRATTQLHRSQGCVCSCALACATACAHAC